MCMHECLLSHVPLIATLGTVAHQASLSIEFYRQEYQSVLPFPPPWDIPNPGIEPASPLSPALASEFFTNELPGNSKYHFPKWRLMSCFLAHASQVFSYILQI